MSSSPEDAGAKYERIKVIGQGSFGAAVLVRNNADGVHYVSKEVNVQAMSAKDRDAAQNEVDVLTRVKHPNIIQYIEHYNKEGTLYIVMEYADGGDLLGRVKQQKEDPEGRRFSEDQVMSWFVQMALGIRHMHENKILHRDIKSANIFLTKDNLVKIGDFGFGKIMANSIAQAKTLCGTPYYFSPELCMGRPYNNKSDVWALGCVLAEMCILGHAYEAKNIKELMKRVIRGTYQTIPSMYSNELHRLIETMLTKDQAARPNIKSILTMEYVQAKLRQFSLADGPAASIVAASPDAAQAVAEMEAFCAQQPEPPLLPIVADRPRSAKSEASSPSKVTLKINRRVSNGAKQSPELKPIIALERPSSTASTSSPSRCSSPSSPTIFPSSEVAKVTKSPPTEAPEDPLPIMVEPVKDSLDALLSSTDPNLPRSTAPALRSSRMASPSLSPMAMSPSQRRSFARPDFPSPKSATHRHSTSGGDVDPFDAGGHTNWNSVLSPEIHQAPLREASTLDRDEFGSFAAKTTCISDEKHRNVMEQVNATLESRPGTASRERRAQSRGTPTSAGLSPANSPTANAHGGFDGRRALLSRDHSPKFHTDDDFSDMAVTVGSHNLRSLLLIELGDELFNKVYRIARDDDDDEATSLRKISVLLGPVQTKDVAPLLFKLVMLEQTAP